MSRPATGEVIVRRRRRGKVFALRFRAYGRRRYLTLGTSAEGWTRKGAEDELANVLADVRRGIWRAPEDHAPVTSQEEPDFHSFASDWFARRRLEGLRPRTLEYLQWALSDHLLPHLRSHLLSEITPQEIDRYTATKIAEGRLSNSSINKTLEVLASVLELGVEYGHVDRNHARGRRRRLPVTKPARAHLERGQVDALLDAAGELDNADRARRRFRRPLLATLVFAGLRVGELLNLRWEHVDLAQGRIGVVASKTQAGVRNVDIQPELRDELVLWKSETAFAGVTDLVFPTGKGRPENRNNVRRRVLLRAVERANGGVEGSLPTDLTPHALRRTFASWLIGEGEDVAYVMDQLGHTDPKMTLGLYAKALRSKRRRAASTATAGVPSPQADASRSGHRGLEQA